MAIATSCGECGRDYSLKDELAGKKFKCKECGAVVVVPAPRKSASPKSSGSATGSKKSSSSAKPTRPAKKKSDDDDFLEALNSSGLEGGDDYRDEEEEAEEELRPVAKKKSTAKKKTKSASSGSGGMLAKIGGGLFTALIVIGFILRLLRAGGVGGGGGTSWQDFTSPDGRYTVTFPGVAKMKPATEPGASTYLAETRNFACAVTYVKLPAGSGAMLAQLPPQALSDQLAQAAFPGQQPLTNRPATLAGRPSQETSFDKLGMRLTERSLIIGDEVFNCEFVSKGDPPVANLNKFFDSFRINGAGGNAAVNNPAAVNVPVAAANPASPTSGNYQQRRKTFQTKLMKSGPAPQEYQNETPPPGVQVVTYPSGQLQLKAWVSVPNGAAGTKAPALVFFHGGFAFGADDLEACRPAMAAGMVVMAPMLRGENGNPGNYELFMGEIDDARAAVQWLSTQSYVDPQRIYTFGHSIGGGVSAVLSLFDDVPIQHGGSSGGLYFESVFAAWQSDGSVPFDMRNPEERRLRLLAGNMRDMRHKHFAYLGAADTLSLFAKDAKAEASGTQCQILSVPGDHMTSFDPALRQYLQIIQSGQ